MDYFAKDSFWFDLYVKFVLSMCYHSFRVIWLPFDKLCEDDILQSITTVIRLFVCFHVCCSLVINDRKDNISFQAFWQICTHYLSFRARSRCKWKTLFLEYMRWERNRDSCGCSIRSNRFVVEKRIVGIFFFRNLLIFNVNIV